MQILSEPPSQPNIKHRTGRSHSVQHKRWHSRQLPQATPNESWRTTAFQPRACPPQSASGGYQLHATHTQSCAHKVQSTLESGTWRRKVEGGWQPQPACSKAPRQPPPANGQSPSPDTLFIPLRSLTNVNFGQFSQDPSNLHPNYATSAWVPSMAPDLHILGTLEACKDHSIQLASDGKRRTIFDASMFIGPLIEKSFRPNPAPQVLLRNKVCRVKLS